MNTINFINMTRVSKNRIDNKSFNKIYGQLIRLVEKAGINRNSDKFLKELLFSTEKVMIAKRVGIILMIQSEIPYRTIAYTLNVSTSTIGRMIDKYNRGDYNYMLSVMKKEEVNLGKILDSILFGILPSRVGKSRYKWLNKI